MNKNQPLFSILIAHYNHWDYFQDCYKSICSQQYGNYEVIIVDDCSTDGSFEKLSELSKVDNKIKLFRNEENRGVGFTKRRCVELANGDICGYLDPDDALTPNALKLVADTFLKHENYGVVYSVMTMCNEDLELQQRFIRAKKVSNQDPWFFNIDTRVAHFFTFKKSIYDLTSGIDDSLKSAVDQDLYLKLYEKASFYFVNKELYLYRLHSSGVSQDKQKSSAKLSFGKVIREAVLRRNITRVNGFEISELNDTELYNQMVIHHNKPVNKILRKIKSLIN